MSVSQSYSRQKRRHQRVRRKVIGSTDRPRLAVYRSNKHMFVQLIDDSQGVTLVSASTLEAEFVGSSTGNCDAAKRVGQTIAQRAVAHGVSRVVFDRGGFQYHGRVAALADAAREAGLEF
ncbi:50S ribosomal protein L18 [Ferrimicrobium acidiphilum]|jgi:large subunit ribosomal protein L18|uniref:Large ribosomal subunit protein uL18 n=1 Tax=Ferrimicrobium acidiphilum DSM 19497 TaxID=1121877 RepID=A0A0D8FWU1_9ACTN|nr:50S ribosomal protein L18 [Ferrimicrobium acidiphilum]KJE77723.1 50S ribosomal protein L18 [Ferrimicrobium acidiphilum DSM 19497]